MAYSAKNKIITAILILLVLANSITLLAFWWEKQKPPLPQKSGPAGYLVKELQLTTEQQEVFRLLVKEHQNSSDALRQNIKTAKDNFFSLLRNPGVTDTERNAAARNVSSLTEQLDVITFDHFKKLRAICNAQQQQRFDAIIDEVMHVIAGPARGPDPRSPKGPPPEEREQGPPPGVHEPPAPPH